jgi:hypothetical protein
LIQDVGNEVCFAREIGVAVVAEFYGERFFELAVLLYSFGMGAEVVAEGDVALELAGFGWAEVEVVAVGVRGGEEGFALGDTEVALVDVAELGEALDGGGEVGGGAEEDVEVDDRFGGEVGDGGAAYVLDCGGDGAENLGDGATDGLELGGPFGVVVDDDYRGVHGFQCRGLVVKRVGVGYNGFTTERAKISN